MSGEVGLGGAYIGADRRRLATAANCIVAMATGTDPEVQQPI